MLKNTDGYSNLSCRSNELKMHDLVGTVEIDLAALIDPDTKVTSTCKSLRVPGEF